MMIEKVTSEHKGSWLVSSISLLFVLLVTLLFADWHAAITLSPLGGRPQGIGRHRLQSEKKVDSIVDDDQTHDEVCRKYLLNFLNGTTDEKDECDGMKNAYAAANCEGDTQNILPSMIRKHHHNGTDDDVLIDDYFEEWKCCSSIYDYYTTHCQRPELASRKLLGIVAVLVICGLAMSLLRTFSVGWIPDAAVCICVGATVGGFTRVFFPSAIRENASFDNDLFLHILLPPIIFQAALNIDKQAFRRDLFPILTFAIAGTVLSALAIGFLTSALTSLGHGTSLPLLDSLLFGSLISSIDPVATLGILSGVGVSKTDTLYTLIFGESLLNDGVAIVLFDTMVTHLGGHAGNSTDMVDKQMAQEISLAFVKCTLASIGIGLACGFVCTVYFWALRRKHTAVVETAIFFCFALIPFYISDALEFSGIIGIMTMGFVTDFFILGGSQSDEAQWMAFMERQNEALRPPDGRTRWWHFYRAFQGTGHLSSRSKHHVGFVAEVIAQIMEMSIFAYLGVFLFIDKHFWDLRLNFIAIFGCIASRVVMVMLFSFAINLFVWLDVERRVARCLFLDRPTLGRRESDDDFSVGSSMHVYLNGRTQRFLMLAGIRGAVSFALVENVPVYDAVRQTGSHFKGELKAMTSSSILFTVFIFGALTYFLVKEESSHRHSSAEHMLSRRLLSAPLGSEADDSDDRLTDMELNSDVGDEN